jgi:NADH dehydrogenase/NADH:ubiquinone oxidoreductase subunit G
MVSLTIDGKKVEANEGRTLLEVARDHHVRIPTLCHNEGLTPYGACRLCMVEVSKGGRSKLVASCLYPVEDGLEVDTKSERVLNSRQAVLEFLLARCPGVEAIQDLAREMGISRTPFAKGKSRCILCGMCVRACSEVVGVSALGFVGRGVDREVGTPFMDASEVCIGCGSCAFVCPTGVIQIEDVGDTRTVSMHDVSSWETQFKLKACPACGYYFAPEAQLEYIRQTWNLPADIFDVCPNCRD